eukprot:g40341.t1
MLKQSLLQAEHVDSGGSSGDSEASKSKSKLSVAFSPFTKTSGYLKKPAQVINQFTTVVTDLLCHSVNYVAAFSWSAAFARENGIDPLPKSEGGLQLDDNAQLYRLWVETALMVLLVEYFLYCLLGIKQKVELANKVEHARARRRANRMQFKKQQSQRALLKQDEDKSHKLSVEIQAALMGTVQAGSHAIGQVSHAIMPLRDVAFSKSVDLFVSAGGFACAVGFTQAMSASMDAEDIEGAWFYLLLVLLVWPFLLLLWAGLPSYLLNRSKKGMTDDRIARVRQLFKTSMDAVVFVVGTALSSAYTLSLDSLLKEQYALASEWIMPCLILALVTYLLVATEEFTSLTGLFSCFCYCCGGSAIVSPFGSYTQLSKEKEHEDDSVVALDPGKFWETFYPQELSHNKQVREERTQQLCLVRFVAAYKSAVLYIAAQACITAAFLSIRKAVISSFGADQSKKSLLISAGLVSIVAVSFTVLAELWLNYEQRALGIKGWIDLKKGAVHSRQVYLSAGVLSQTPTTETNPALPPPPSLAESSQQQPSAQPSAEATATTTTTAAAAAALPATAPPAQADSAQQQQERKEREAMHAQKLRRRRRIRRFVMFRNALAYLVKLMALLVGLAWNDYTLSLLSDTAAQHYWLYAFICTSVAVIFTTYVSKLTCSCFLSPEEAQAEKREKEQQEALHDADDESDSEMEIMDDILDEGHETKAELRRRIQQLQQRLRERDQARVQLYRKRSRLRSSQHQLFTSASLSFTRLALSSLELEDLAESIIISVSIDVLALIPLPFYLFKFY